jgi:hypothetical protein
MQVYSNRGEIKENCQLLEKSVCREIRNNEQKNK